MSDEIDPAEWSVILGWLREINKGGSIEDLHKDLRARIAALEKKVGDAIKCEHCETGVAVCIGEYEGRGGDKFACNECCGHGNEDGYCKPIEEAARESGGEGT